MIAAWYDRQGPAAEVLQVGELPDLQPGPGEVRVRLTRSGVNPGDTKKRAAWAQGAPMAFPRIVPHSDGAGIVDAVGAGVDPARAGRRVWVMGAQSYRPGGTAAGATVVPDALAVDLPGTVGDDLGACLGIPGVTAHRAVFADGPVAGQVVLVHGVLGAVGSLAAQLARWGGARVLTTVRGAADLDRARAAGWADVLALDAGPGAGAAALRAAEPAGVDRVVEVAFSANVELDAAVLRTGGVVAAYASPDPRPAIPFWPMLFANLVVRLLGSDDFPAAARAAAARDLTAAAAEGALQVAVGAVLPLAQVARAHDLVDSGRAGGRVLLALD